MIAASKANPDAPIGIADAYTVVAGVALTVPAPGLIANDYDPDGDAFILSNFFQPANGTLTSIVTDGSFVYVPDPGFTGTDTFTYLLREQDTEVFSEPVTVTIEVGMPPPPDDACPSALVISDFRTAPNAQEFVDLTNVGDDAIDFGEVDCVLGGFRSASYVGLPASGTLAPGETLRFGASASGADVGFPDGTLFDAYASLALLDRASLPNGTGIPDVQADLVTSLVYLAGANGMPQVFGFYHTDEAHEQLYCSLYAGELHPYGQGLCAAMAARGTDAQGGTPEALDFAAMMEAALAEEARAAAEAAVPTVFALHGVYPNPLQERATLSYDLPEASEVRVAVYDVLGRTVAVLVEEAQEAGRYEAVLDASGLASGTYVVRVTTGGGFAATQRLTIVR